MEHWAWVYQSVGITLKLLDASKTASMCGPLWHNLWIIDFGSNPRGSIRQLITILPFSDEQWNIILNLETRFSYARWLSEFSFIWAHAKKKSSWPMRTMTKNSSASITLQGDLFISVRIWEGPQRIFSKAFCSTCIIAKRYIGCWSQSKALKTKPP